MSYDDKWSARVDVFRASTDFSDLMKAVASTYELYARAHAYLGPWIAKQNDSNFMVPNTDEIKAAVGRPRSCINSSTYSKFIESLFQFALKSKGRKALIQPNPTTHHSAQFPAGTFNISVAENPPALRDDKGVRAKAKTIHRIEFFGCDSPVFVENLQMPADAVKFVIVRPKLGRLGSASIKKWEVLLFRQQHTYLIEHVDSELDPRWAGKM